jgi:hypothetical protein
VAYILNLSALGKYFYPNILNIFFCVQSKLHCDRGYSIQKKKERLHAPVATPIHFNESYDYSLLECDTVQSHQHSEGM